MNTPQPFEACPLSSEEVNFVGLGAKISFILFSQSFLSFNARLIYSENVSHLLVGSSSVLLPSALSHLPSIISVIA